MRASRFLIFCTLILCLQTFHFTTRAESILPPCTRFRYIEVYRVDDATIPGGLRIFRVPAEGSASFDLDYLSYQSQNPLLIDGEGGTYLKVVSGKVSNRGKKSFEGLQGIPGDPINQVWFESPEPAVTLSLSRLVRGNQMIEHPFPLGSDQKKTLPEYGFTITGLSEPQWKNARITGRPFRITGTVFYKRLERMCPPKH